MSSAACIFCKIIKGRPPAATLPLQQILELTHHGRRNPLPQALRVQLRLRLPGHSTTELRPCCSSALPFPPSRHTPRLTFPAQLVIPKHHGAKLTDIPDDALSEILPVVKKLAQASGAENWNVLQNNGRLAHQVVDHVHFHMIPKPNEKEGLGVGWPAKETDMEGLKKLHEMLKAKM